MIINGHKLKQVRESHGLDRQAVDDALGLARRDTRFFETGRKKANSNRAPSRSARNEFFLLCDFYQVNPCDMLI